MMRGPLKFLNRDEYTVISIIMLLQRIYSERERNCIGKSVAVQIWIHYFVHSFSAKTPLEIPQSLMLLNRETCICHSSRTIGWKLTPVFIGFIAPIRSAAPRDEKCLGGKKKAKRTRPRSVGNRRALLMSMCCLFRRDQYELLSPIVVVLEMELA